MPGILELLIILGILGLLAAGVVSVIVIVLAASKRQGGSTNPNLYACNDVIAPSVIATDQLQKPLGRYYLYYAPHNAPGGGSAWPTRIPR